MKLNEYDYLMSAQNEIKDYVGLWIAIVDRKIVAKGDSARQVLKQVREEYPDREPFITKIPKNKVMLL
jgi:hypothetical protein